MSLQTQILNPVTLPSMMYPQFMNIKPGRKYYKCPRCHGNMYSEIWKQIYRKEDVIFAFKCDACTKRWFISSKLVLNDIFEEQIQRLARFTKKTGKEFAALIIKTPKGIRLDMIEVGDEGGVSFGQTHKLGKGEKIVGSVHNHPNSNLPSDYDIATFLRDDWEKISIVNGAKGTVNVMVKTSETVKIKDVRKWILESQKLSLKQKGEKYKFMIFRGKVNNLTLICGKFDKPYASLEKLMKKI